MRKIAVFALFFIGLAARAEQPVLITDPASSTVASEYISFLQKEMENRGNFQWQVAKTLDTAPSGSPIVVLGTASQMKALLGPDVYVRWQTEQSALNVRESDEGYSVTSLAGTHRSVLVLSGKGLRGELFAIGWLLRNAEINRTGIVIPSMKSFATSPDKPIRGYQIGYRMKNNTYDAWNLSQFEQQMLDLAVFGMNTMQVVAPVSDDAPSSPLFPAPAEETVIGLSRLSQKYGLRYDLYYPEMAKDYSDPSQVNAELKRFGDLVSKLPQLDSIHVPGGDPGHTSPDILLPLIEKEGVILHHYHPQAEIWVSAQGFDRERYERFYKILQGKPQYLTGVFFGPQSRESMEEQRRKIPAMYPLEFYPDTAHTMHSQFPVPKWDPIYALTEGREPICPRPFGFTHIYQHFRSLNSGFIVYSEGVNDDVNKVLWGALGWSPNASTHQVLEEYAHYFFRTNRQRSFAIASDIESLEKNWSGPLLSNTGIAPTLAHFQEDARYATQNWRWNSLMYRAVYDRYVQIKRRRELSLQTAAIQKLTMPGSDEDRISAARSILDRDNRSDEERTLNHQLYALAQKLFDEVGLQLSVKRYGASNWERGANLDRVETPLNDRIWLETKFDAIQKSSESEQDKLIQLQNIANWNQPIRGALYDDLGDPEAEPHLVRGEGWLRDPEMYHTAIDGIADETLEKGWRLSWLSYAETLYEEPLHLHYEHLDPHRHYRLRITYAGEAYTLPMRLMANDTIEVHPLRLRKSNPETVEFDLAPETTHSDTLDLRWFRAYGAGGGGRGGQVAEVWLLSNE